MHARQVGEAALGERAQQVERGRAPGGSRARSRCGSGRAGRGVEREVVDHVAAERRQLDAVARLGGRRARLGELAGDAADLHGRDAAAVREHDGHLQDDLELVADGVGRERRRTTRRSRRPAARTPRRSATAAERVGEAARLAGEHERRDRAQLVERARRARPASGQSGCCAAGSARQRVGCPVAHRNSSPSVSRWALTGTRSGPRARRSPGRSRAGGASPRTAPAPPPAGVNSVAWMPWNSPSSQPTSCACASRSSDSLGVSLGERQRRPRRAPGGGRGRARPRARGATLVDLAQAPAAGVVERRAAHLVEHVAHHRRDADQLGGAGDLLGRLAVVGVLVGRGAGRVQRSRARPRRSTSSGCTRSRSAEPIVASDMGRRIGAAAPPQGTGSLGYLVAEVIRGGRRTEPPPWHQRRRTPTWKPTTSALVVAIGRYNEDALAEAYRRHAGAVFALAATDALGADARRGGGAGDLPPALGAPRALRPLAWCAALVPAHGRARPLRRPRPCRLAAPRPGGALRPRRPGRRLRPRPRGVRPERRRTGARGARDACPTANAKPSSSRTSAATRTERWRASSTNPRAPSRAGSAPASCGCARSCSSEESTSHGS